MSLTIAERMRLYSHFKVKGSLLIRNKRHEDDKILNINNKKLRNAVQSLRDQGYVVEHCSWRQLYCLATESGMQFFESECKVEDVIDEEMMIEVGEKE